MSENQEQLHELADEALSTFEKIEKTAKEKLGNGNLNKPESSLAAGNTFTSNAGANLSSIHAENRQGYDALTNEPAIARVIAEDEDGVEKIFYISRHSSLPLAGQAQLASYNSPIGRLASLPLGDERQIKINGRDVTFSVLSKATFKPFRQLDGWDSGPNMVQDEVFGTCTIDSLRKLLDSGMVDASDELEALLAEGGAVDNISEGLKHQLRTAMGLRDQPILDQFQDEIFRLPINSQLLILGPPGTGKTTTLIKRLGQKLDRVHLEEHEQRFAVDKDNGTHAVNWIMFTPSELLKHYVKEAFNREQVPASDDQIKTWQSFRADIARNVLGVLKNSAGSGGKFIYKNEQQYLHGEIVEDAREWCELFSDFHQERLSKQLSDGMEIVRSSCPQDKRSVVVELENAVDGSAKSSLVGTYAALYSIEKKLEEIVRKSKTVSDDLIKKQRNFLFNNNKKVFEELAQYLVSIGDSDDSEDEEELFDDEGEAISQSQSEIQKAVNAYLHTIRSLSRHKYLKRSVKNGSRTALIRDWLKDRLPDDSILLKVGQEIAFQNGLRRFINASRRFVSDVPNSYVAFKRKIISDGATYCQTPASMYHVDSTELDMVVLTMLRNTRILLSLSFVSRNTNDPKFTNITKIASLFRTQVLIDEATDFSVLQLACMESLTALDAKSLFACGDFNQRITGNGIRSLDQVRWVSSNLRDERITTVYRQSKLLNDLSLSLIEVQGGDVDSLGVLPESSSHIGVAPILVESSCDLIDTANWLSQRVVEIEGMVHQIPTIAVLVNREEDVMPMTVALNQYLEQYNLKAMACLEGQVLGQENDVRVFDVRHIKGLEFEAVFFVDVDMLANDMPDLFDRYLYVGSTRAATYLGLTCRGSLPDSLGTLRSQFVLKWD